MKEIQGKIKFVAIPLINGMIGYLPLRYEKIGLLSEITEKQATEFVECVWSMYRNYQLGDLIPTAKESLISLLKANNIWIKKWYAEDYEHLPIMRKKLCDSAPDDLLLIKLQ